MFKGFDKRLKRDVQRLVDNRLRESEELSKHKVNGNETQVSDLTLSKQYFRSSSLNPSMLRLLLMQCNAMLFGSVVV
jgi:hypothetical protein